MPGTNPALLLERARAGDESARGQLLECYRDYLHLFARVEIGRAPSGPVDASDVVQETLLEAHRDLPQFRGEGEPELASWLRQILVHNLAGQARHNRRLSREAGRQVSLDKLLESSGIFLARARVEPVSSPSEVASRRERAVLLADALARLRPEQREVVILRVFENRPFAEIAALTGRSVDAARKLFMRSLMCLHRLLGTEP